MDRINGYTTSVLSTYKVRDTLSTRIGTPLGVNYYIMPLHQLTPMERTDKVDSMQVPVGVQPLALRASTIRKSVTRPLFNLTDAVRAVSSAVPAQAAPPAAAQAQRLVGDAAPVVAGATVGRKIKVSRVLDPMDDGLVDPFTPAQVNAFYANYRGLKHGELQKEVEPTAEQISAFHARVVLLQAAPYGDFSILTPFGRRMAKVLKHRAWLPNRDGTYRTVEVPGPDSYDVWYACWRVYACCCLMLR